MSLSMEEIQIILYLQKVNHIGEKNLFRKLISKNILKAKPTIFKR